jgi:hypothetical protein
MADWSKYATPDLEQPVAQGKIVASTQDKWSKYSVPDNIATSALTTEQPLESKKLQGTSPLLEVPNWLKKYLPDPTEDTIMTNPLTMAKALGKDVPVAGRFVNENDEDVKRAQQQYPGTSHAANIAGSVLPYALGGEALLTKLGTNAGAGTTGMALGTMNTGAGIADKLTGLAQGEEQKPSDYAWEGVKGYGTGFASALLARLLGGSTGATATTARQNAENYAEQGSRIKAAREGLFGAGIPDEHPILETPGITSEVGDLFGMNNKHIDALRDAADTGGRNAIQMQKIVNKAGTDPEVTPHIVKLLNDQIRVEKGIAQESALRARGALDDLSTTAQKAPRNVHPDTPADRTSNAMRNLSEGGVGAMSGALLAMATHQNPLLAMGIGMGAPGAARMVAHGAHSMGIPESIAQMAQSKSGSPLMNAAIMHALGGGSDTTK